jgi:hypothetical protein
MRTFVFLNTIHSEDPPAVPPSSLLRDRTTIILPWCPRHPPLLQCNALGSAPFRPSSFPRPPYLLHPSLRGFLSTSTQLLIMWPDTIASPVYRFVFFNAPCTYCTPKRWMMPGGGCPVEDARWRMPGGGCSRRQEHAPSERLFNACNTALAAVCPHDLHLPCRPTSTIWSPPFIVLLPSCPHFL